MEMEIGQEGAEMLTMGGDVTVSHDPAVTGHQTIIIKQEHPDHSIEVMSAPTEEGVPISFDDFISMTTNQLKDLQEEKSYLLRCFEVMYKYKAVFDVIVEDYFKEDVNFKYRSVLESLEGDLVAVIAENEEKYQEFLQDINTEMTVNVDDQLEFVDDFYSSRDFDDDDEMIRITETIDGAEYAPGTGIRKLPGQKTAPQPECPACGEKSRCRTKLEAHIQEHQDNPLVVCNYLNCEMTFKLHALARHEKDYHPESCLTCEVCNEMFESKSMLLQHYKLHIKKKDRLKCDFPGCTYTDIYTGRMERHKKKEHNIEVMRQFRCDQDGCDRVFRDRASFYTHSLIHKDRTLVYKHRCTIEGCGAVFKRRRNLAFHMAKHGLTNKKKAKCPVDKCGKMFLRTELQNHMETTHPQHPMPDWVSDPEANPEGEEVPLEEIPSTSTSVPSSTPTASTPAPTPSGRGRRSKRARIEADSTEQQQQETLVENSAESTIEQMVTGEQEGGEYSNSNNISKGDETLPIEYITEVTEEEQMLSTQCELCSMEFETARYLLNHLKERHHQYTVRAYRCDFANCDFATHFRSVLGKHKNDVHGGKYKCEVCGKLSKDSGNHNRHRNIHKNILFRCRVPNCEAVYKSPKAYYVHVLTHSNEQPVYTCDFPDCKYVTYYMNTLNVHKLTHSDVRRFFCPYEGCAKGFKRNGDLNKHVVHSHKGVKRPSKKRRTTDLNNSTMLFRCTWSSCHFTSPDPDALNKHEDEHAALQVETI